MKGSVKIGVLLLIIGILSIFIQTQANSHCGSAHILETKIVNQTDGELTSLDILILDIRDVKTLIEEGKNEQAIEILRSAAKRVRKVEEFNSKTKKTTSKRISKGIKLLQQNKNEEALDLIQTAIDALIESGLASPSDFE